MGCYSFLENSDEIRFYQRDTRLDNTFMQPMKISAQLLLLNILRNKLITFRADGQIIIYELQVRDENNRKYLDSLLQRDPFWHFFQFLQRGGVNSSSTAL